MAFKLTVDVTDAQEAGLVFEQGRYNPSGRTLTVDAYAAERITALLDSYVGDRDREEQQAILAAMKADPAKRAAIKSVAGLV